MVQRRSETFRTPVENLVNTGEEPVFAFYLENQIDEELAFGGVNSAHCSEILVYINLESTSYWQLGRPEALVSSPCGPLCMGGIDDVDSKYLNAAVRQRR